MFTLQFGLKIFLELKKVKKTLSWTYFINDLNGKKIVGNFYKKELQKTNQKEFRIKKVIKKNDDKLYLYIICCIILYVRLIKKI